VENSNVIKKIKSADDSPLEFDELVEAWNKLCEQAWAENPDDVQFADIENAAIAALSEQSGQSTSGQLGNEISGMLSSFDYPTYLVSVDGRVASANTAASIEFDLDIGNRIDHLPYALDGAQPISAVIRESMDEEKENVTDAILKRAHAAENERDATIAITPSFGRVPMALVFVITTQWKPKSTELLKRHFGLTNTESEVLISFVDGYSSQDIAQQRNRSHTTIRTQFQSIMNKTGTRNQTELLRTVLSISDFTKGIGEIVDAVNHPHRRRAEVLREGGRMIEVTLMGDTKGKPMLTIANAANYTFNAIVEQALYDAGLYIISICAPGCGRTDPVPEGMNRIECVSEDSLAVLDQLRINSCTMLAYNANPPICFLLASRNGHRFNHLIQIAGCAPYRFVHATNTTQSSWVTGILKAGVSHPGMKSMLFRGTMKAWATIGAKQFMRLQMSSNPIDSKHVLSVENLREYEHALKTATRGGVSAAADDLALTFEDWAAEVEAIDSAITVVHGVEDKLVTVDIVRRFAEAFPEKIELIEIEDAGMPLLQSHTSEIVRLLKSAVEVDKPNFSTSEIDNLVSAQIPAFKRSETPQH